MAQRFFLFGSVLVTLFSLLTVNVQAQHGRTDPLGTLTATQVTCPNTGLTGTACYALNVSCPRIQNYTVYLKTIAPSGTPTRAVTLTQGGSAIALYENYNYGTVTIQDLVSAQFLAIEITFGNPFNTMEQGWQTKANGAGVRAASCRYATVTAWIKNNLAPQVPLCAAGVSAGSQQIAEGLAHFGLSQYLTFAELASGPPFNRTDDACIPAGRNSAEYCSGAFAGMVVDPADAQDYIDPAYPGPWCSRDIQRDKMDHKSQFFNDSVTSSDASLNYPTTNVWFLYGGQDTTSAINQGENYRLQVTSTNHAACVPSAPHLIPDDFSGAQQIATDMIGQCH
jgi:hypothetical protein